MSNLNLQEYPLAIKYGNGKSYTNWVLMGKHMIIMNGGVHCHVVLPEAKGV